MKKSLKQSTMRLLNINETEYKKLYKDYYYKLRSFEAETGAERRNAARELYYTYKNIKTGKGLSSRRSQVLTTPAMSKATRERLARSTGQTQAERRALAYGEKVFAGLIKKSPIASKIWNDDKLSVTEKLKKLTDYANDRIKKGKAKENADGSIDVDDFDSYGGYDFLEGWE